MSMAIVSRTIGFSLLAGGLGAGLGLALFGKYEDYLVPCLLLACVGAIIGAIAGAAQGIVSTQRQRLSS